MDKLKVLFEIHTTELHERSGVAGNGKPYKMFEQEAWVLIGDAPYPQRTKLTLDNGQAAYPKGHYQMHERSFFIGKFDSFQVRPFLVPVAASVQQPKATA